MRPLPAISVVIPSHNRPELLREAVASVRGQTRPVHEIVVVDDASQPAVDASALQTADGPPLRVVRNEQAQGLAWCRHQGVEAASGDYVVQLDDDDLFAPGLVEACAGLLDGEPDTQVLFIGTRGFGGGSEHFNRVHPEGVLKVVTQGDGRTEAGNLVRFGPALVVGLLRQVPMPFQRVMVRRDTWHQVHRLRVACYRQVFGLPSDEAARERIRGTLRDSEWAIYAAVACARLALIDLPLYLQRCEGQGSSSLPVMRRKHIVQKTEILSVLHSAAPTEPTLQPWQLLIRQTLANARFDAAYHFTQIGEWGLALEYWRGSWALGPSPRHLRLLLRWALSRVTGPAVRSTTVP